MNNYAIFFQLLRNEYIHCGNIIHESEYEIRDHDDDVIRFAWSFSEYFQYFLDDEILNTFDI